MIGSNRTVNKYRWYEKYDYVLRKHVPEKGSVNVYVILDCMGSHINPENDEYGKMRDYEDNFITIQVVSLDKDGRYSFIEKEYTHKSIEMKFSNKHSNLFIPTVMFEMYLTDHRNRPVDSVYYYNRPDMKAVEKEIHNLLKSNGLYNRRNTPVNVIIIDQTYNRFVNYQEISYADLLATKNEIFPSSTNTRLISYDNEDFDAAIFRLTSYKEDDIFITWNITKTFNEDDTLNTYFINNSDIKSNLPEKRVIDIGEAICDESIPEDYESHYQNKFISFEFIDTARTCMVDKLYSEGYDVPGSKKYTKGHDTRVSPIKGVVFVAGDCDIWNSINDTKTTRVYDKCLK